MLLASEKEKLKKNFYLILRVSNCQIQCRKIDHSTILMTYSFTAPRKIITKHVINKFDISH